jgi:hypothetical protein
MGIFGRSTRARISANALEDAAEINETTSKSGGAAKMFFRRNPSSMDQPISIRRLRASADPDDDGAETELLNEERHHDEGY